LLGPERSAFRCRSRAMRSRRLGRARAIAWVSSCASSPGRGVASPSRAQDRMSRAATLICGAAAREIEDAAVENEHSSVHSQSPARRSRRACRSGPSGSSTSCNRCATASSARTSASRPRRRDAIDPHAGLRELLAERLRQRDHARFGCAVGACVGVAFLARDRRDVHDTSVVGRAIVAASARQQWNVPVRLMSMTSRQPSSGTPGQRVRTGDPGAVDQRVDAAERAQRRVARALDGR